MKLLVAHDGSSQADKALDAAGAMAKAMGAGIAVVTVAPDLCLSSEELTQTDCDLVASSLQTEARSQMKKVSDSLAAKGFTAEFVIRQGRPVEQIIAAAKELGADAIVLGSVGKHGAGAFFMGSVSAKVAEHAPMSVFVIR